MIGPARQNPWEGTRPVLVLSPHLDDAWLSAAALLQHRPCEVWTVFAGAPIPARSTEWDARCGFADSDETVAARRAEDAAAFGDTGHQVRLLDLLDAAYHDGSDRRADVDRLVARLSAWAADHPDGILVAPVVAGVWVDPAWWQRLRERLRRPAGPAPSGRQSDGAESAPSPEHRTAEESPGHGLRSRTGALIRSMMHAAAERRRRRAQRAGMAANPDHELVRRAALRVAADVPGLSVLLSEDLPYLWHRDGTQQAQALRERGWDVREMVRPVDVQDKERRVAEYRSQTRLLDPVHRRLEPPASLPATERYWWIAGVDGAAGVS